ncbi:exonuclease [Gordonia phage Ronaldo]|uniref:Cas4 family exonuclease n=2 Tax=Ronaldovirus ronaldo TaxID=2734270 RepID=A0A6B9L8C6_9CAUD|nr:exonuclease [Gordonia phage Ronaldo]AXN53648.1 Cas4 family exonuclease [Gordonia phage Ronaldo]QHB38202.1 Cas4 family exonuclease [Gordonia phage Volt]
MLDPLSDKEGLYIWKMVHVGIGVAKDDGIRSDFISMVNEGYPDPWNSGKHKIKYRLIKAAEAAMAASGTNKSSSAGTEFHGIGERINRGQPVHVRKELQPLVDQYCVAVRDFEFISIEAFVVNDALEVAGSVDYVVRLPDWFSIPLPSGEDLHLGGKVVVADLKTGQYKPFEVGGQLAAYGFAQKYDQATNLRSPIHEDLCTDWGLVIHFPIRDENPEVRFYLVDINKGLENAEIAKAVLFARNNIEDYEVKEPEW